MRCLVGLLVVSGLAACSQESAPSGVAPVRAGSDGGPVARELAHLPSLEDRGFIAVVTASRSVEVQPQFAGELAEVHVRAGDRVSEGELIAVLDARPLKEELRSAKAARQSATAAAGSARVEVTNARRRLAQAQSDHDEGIGSSRDVQEAKAALDTAKAAHTSARAGASGARSNVNAAKRRLDETRITAPFDGTISKRYRDPGAAVGPGQPVVRLIATGAMWVRFAVPPERIDEIAVGDQVRVDIDGLKDPVEAVVRQRSPELDPASKLIFVEAEITLAGEQTRKIQPGMEAWVN